MKVILKIIDNFQYVNWTGVESKLSSEYFDVGFRDYTDIVLGIWKIYFISLFPIWYLLVSEFDIEYKPIYFLFRALYLISNVIWVYRESCFRWHWFFNPVKGKISIFEKIKTKWSFNESLIRLKMWIDNLNYQIWKVIENGVPPVLLQSDS